MSALSAPASPLLARKRGIWGALAVLALTASCSMGSRGASGAGTSALPGSGGAISGSGSTGAGSNADGPVEKLAVTRFDGSTTSLSAYRGRPLVVNFFASWCAPCVREMTDFEQVHRQLGDRVAFLGVNVRDRAEDGRALVAQTRISYDVVRDPRGDLLQRLGGVAMPTTVLFDAQGRQVSLQSRTYDAASLRSAIEKKLLG